MISSIGTTKGILHVEMFNWKWIFDWTSTTFVRCSPFVVPCSMISTKREWKGREKNIDAMQILYTVYLQPHIKYNIAHTWYYIVIIWPSTAYCCAILINSIFQYLEEIRHALFYSFFSLSQIHTSHTVAVVAFHTQTMRSVLRYFAISLISISVNHKR